MVEARDAAKHLPVLRTALTAKRYLAPSVNSAETQKPSEVKESVKLHLWVQMWSAIPEKGWGVGHQDTVVTKSGKHPGCSDMAVPGLIS